MPHDVTETWVLRPATSGDPTDARVSLRRFTHRERAVRAAKMTLAWFVAAALVAVVPIIHLVGIPLAVLAGVVFGVRQYGVTETLQSVEAPCPKCGTAQRFFAGFGVGSPRLPMTLTCEACGKELRLERNTAG
jgi:predicted RNA-binding Zn-ribbon protein involved in translation (DUF1610 family)